MLMILELLSSASSPDRAKQGFFLCHIQWKESLSPEGGISTLRNPVVFLFRFCRNVQRERKRRGAGGVVLYNMYRPHWGNDGGIISLLFPENYFCTHFSPSTPRSRVICLQWTDRTHKAERSDLLSVCAPPPQHVLVWQQFSIIAVQIQPPWLFMLPVCQNGLFQEVLMFHYPRSPSFHEETPELSSL